MMFRKYYERKAELQAEIEALETRKAQLEMELHDSENLRAYEKMYMEEVVLNKYEYAVLLPKNDYCLRVWNNGRFEQGIRSVELSQESCDYLPHLEIHK